MSENLAKSGKRYICFTPEMQDDFDRLPPKHQLFVLYVANGAYSRKGAYVAAGYQDTPNAKKSAYDLEHKIPRFQEFVDALRGQKAVQDAYNPDSDVSKTIDDLAEKELPPAPIVPAEVVGTGASLDVTKLSAEQAARIKFYRDIASGKVKSVKRTKTYDRDNNLTGEKVEEVTDVQAQMRARAELDKILGMNEMLKVGEVKAGSITIKIVDCSNREALEDPRNDMIYGTLSEETSDE